MRLKILLCFFGCISILTAASNSAALDPAEVILIANRNVPAGIDLADHYRKRRNIPAGNLLLVSLPDAEDCSREVYEENLLHPLRRFIGSREGQPVRALALFYGIPLRVAAPAPDRQTRLRLEDLKSTRRQLVRQSRNRTLTAQQRRERELAVAALAQRIRVLEQGDRGAAVDSEIALALIGDYPLDGRLPNPLAAARRGLPPVPERERVLLVSRLDGPRPAIVRRLIDDSLLAEEKGLQGTAYFDARRAFPTEQNPSAYARYDASLHNAAAVTEKLSRLPVVLDQREALFQPGQAPAAALYCGWYSLGRYVDAFDWRPGAVAYHIASAECTTLKRPDSQVWCKRLLEEGVAATLGPVAEPYVQGFPLPERFFALLLDGYYTLAESYFLTVPYLSWQMILIGDPLYRPFRHSVSPP